MATAACKIVCAEGSFLNDDNECEKRREKTAGRHARDRPRSQAAPIRAAYRQALSGAAGVLPGRAAERTVCVRRRSDQWRAADRRMERQVGCN